MEPAASPEGLGLPCTPEQALALYWHIFRRPAGLDQLQAVLRQRKEGVCGLPQGQEGWGCPLGLGLPAVLLELERRRRAQEQLLWDLELLTGAGLGLLWPPRAQFYSLSHQAQCAWSQQGTPGARKGRDSEQPMSVEMMPCGLGHLQTFQSPRLFPPLQAGDSLSQNHQLQEGVQAGGLSAVSGLDEARSDLDPSGESPGVSAGPTHGCLQDLDLTSRTCGEPQSSENLAQREERSQAESQTPKLHQPPSGSLQGRELAQGAPGPSGLPEPHDHPEGQTLSLGQERAVHETLLRKDTTQIEREGELQDQKGETSQEQRGSVSQSQKEEYPQGTQGNNQEVPLRQREKTHQGHRGKAPQGPAEEVSQGPRGNGRKCETKGAPQGQETNILASSDGSVLAWEVARGDEYRQLQNDDHPLGLQKDFCRSRGEQMPQPAGTEGASPQRNISCHRGELDLAMPKPAPHLPGTPPIPQLPGAAMLEASSIWSSGQQELPALLLGPPGLGCGPRELQGPGGGPGAVEHKAGEVMASGLAGALGERRAQVPKPSKVAWPGPQDSKTAAVSVSTAQWEIALGRLLELHRAARRRRQQDREQQRLRVLERLCIARNRHSQVHPLGPPASPAQLLPQEDSAGQRRALREQLQQLHRERTGRLRALGARNTQNFRELLWPPCAVEPAPGE